MRNSKNITTFFFISPWLAIFALFQLYPIIYSLFISFTDLKAISINPPQFIWFKNYYKILFSEDFQDAFYNSIKFVLFTVPITMVIALLVASLLQRQLRFKRFYTAALFAPTVTSTFVVASLFTALYADAGLFNAVLEFFSIEPVRWLKNPDTALYSIMFMNIWASFGFYSLVFLAAMQTIPNDYYEVAQLEGASYFSYLKAVIWPHLRLTVLVASLLNSILAFQVFGEIFIMTQGGPINSTKSLVYFIYDEAFENQKLGYASAAAYLVFIFLLGLSGLHIFFSRAKKQNV